MDSVLDLDSPPTATDPSPVSPLRRVLGWCVHFYTALGLAMAAGMAILIVRGDPASLLWAFVLMIVASVVDATDGTFARMVRVREATPNFDGRRLDDITDFLTYTFMPLFLLWRADLLAPYSSWFLLFPLLASAYGFCQVSVKTEDGYFLGFPSLWNIVAFYLYTMHPSGGWILGFLCIFSLLTFVPSRYLYPSQPGLLNLVSNVLSMAWGLLLCWVLWRLLSPSGPPEGRGDERTDLLLWVSLLYPSYYLAASWWISLKIWWPRDAEDEDEVIEVGIPEPSMVD